jgi:hypothetical protein
MGTEAQETKAKNDDNLANLIIVRNELSFIYDPGVSSLLPIHETVASLTCWLKSTAKC